MRHCSCFSQLLSIFLFFKFVHYFYLRVCVLAHTRVEVGGHPVELVISFYYVGPRDQTHVACLGDRCSYLVSHLVSPLHLCLRQGLLLNLAC